MRDRTLARRQRLPALWAGKGSTTLLLSALADDEPSLRRMGLTLASTKPGFWSRPDAQEYLKRLLVDPDSQVRLAALSTVEEHGLIRSRRRPWRAGSRRSRPTRRSRAAPKGPRSSGHRSRCYARPTSASAGRGS